jgi:hypothetical protein
MARAQLRIIALACDQGEDRLDDLRIDVRSEGRTLASRSQSMRQGQREEIGLETSFDDRATVVLFQVPRNHSLGEFEVAARPTATRDSPYHQFTWHGAHYTLSYRILPGPPGEGDTVDDLACCAVELPQRCDPPRPCARSYDRQESQRFVLSCPNAEEMRRWPRYIMARKVQRATHLYVYQPGHPHTALREFTRDDFHDYLECAGRNPDIANAATWGPSQTITVPVCRLADDGDGRRRLVWEPARGIQWTWEVYNLDSSQPQWRPLLERTLKRFPIEFLRAIRFRTIYLDFRVGTLRIGVGRTNQAAVGDGGTNWGLGGGSPADPSRVSAVCVSYAALNRPWTESGHALDASDADIDASFNDVSRTAYTIYHEFGHLYANCPRQPEQIEDPAELARQRSYHEAIAREMRRSPPEQCLWLRYNHAIGYDLSGGLSKGKGEGFAEAFRKRMDGTSVGGGAIRNEVENALDHLGLPTLESVNEARAAINRG